MRIIPWVILIAIVYLVFLTWKRRTYERRAMHRHNISEKNIRPAMKEAVTSQTEFPDEKAVAHQNELPDEDVRSYGEGDILLQITPDRMIRWIKDGAIIRLPAQSSVRKLHPNFTVCGKKYRYITDLTAKKVDEGKRLYQDIHGRYVLDMKERYPIFDSYDAASEDRYYHWYLVLEAERMSLVFHDDGGIEDDEITEDVQKLPEQPYRILGFWHYLNEEGILKLENTQ